MMDSARLERIQSLFHDAADLSADEQQRLLREIAASDPALARDVTALLDEDARASSVLHRSVAHVAGSLLGNTDTYSPAIDRVGPYRVQRVLGEGGMGTVYLAEREDLGSLVAIKILRDAWLSPARRDRFASEQRTLAQLNHPYIARLYDADTLGDGTPCIVMEYVEGVPLTAYCDAHDCSIDRRLQLFRAVCEALQYAHQHAVIHRDLKPSNILVKADGTVRLLDFGIAKHLDEPETSASHTVTGLRFMTPAYAAPEQIRGGRVGIHTDVYSLGVVLYELLAGALPFDLANLTPAEAISIVVGHDAAKPSMRARASAQANAARARLSRRAWPDLDVLCLTAMHKDPERRYRSVEALIRDLDHYMRGEPLDAQPDSARYKLGKFVTRNRRAVAAAVVVSVVGIGMATFFTVRLARARNAALAEAARTARIQQFMMNLFEGGDEEAGPSKALEVSTIIDRGVLEARALNTEPRVQAELYQTLGSIYAKLGKFDQADSLLQTALDERRRFFGASSPEVADALVELGMLRMDQARYDDAVQLVGDGLAMSTRLLPAGAPAVVKAMTALGGVYDQRGDYDKAIAVLEDAVRLQTSQGAATSDMSESLTELANAHFYAGHFHQADTLNQRVLAVDRELYGPRHPHVADDLINLGAIQYQWGHMAEAEQYDRQALDIIRAFYGEDHPETASALTILGRTLISEHQPAAAAPLLTQALAIQEHTYGKVHPRVASALNELGTVALKQGKLDDAQADYERMAAIYREVYAGDHYYLGVALSNLAGVYTMKKQFAEAERLFRQALDIYARTLAPEHQLVGIARIRLGNVLTRAGRFADGARESSEGYEILRKGTDLPMQWVDNALTDVALDYDSLGDRGKAGEVRARLDSLHRSGAAVVAK